MNWCKAQSSFVFVRILQIIIKLAAHLALTTNVSLLPAKSLVFTDVNYAPLYANIIGEKCKYKQTPITNKNKNL